MTWQVFGTLPAGNNPLSVFDTLTAQIAKCVLVPCTAAGTNIITLTATTNAPLTQIAGYSDLITFQFIAAASSTGTVTAAFGALAPLNVYFADGVTQVAAGGLTGGQPYTLIFSQALNSGMGGFYLGQAVQRVTGVQPTRQVFLSGSGTYTTPVGAKQLVIRMCGGGGSGGNSASVAGNAGTASQFNGTTFTANPGQGGGAGQTGAISSGGAGGAGGTGGSGAASVRQNGGQGTAGMNGTTGVGNTISLLGGVGGVNYFGGGPGGAGAPNTGAGSQGVGNTVANNSATSAGGGGAGEYCEIIINTPVATYTYQVGAGGAAPAGGFAAASGIIIVEERY